MKVIYWVGEEIYAPPPSVNLDLKIYARRRSVNLFTNPIKDISPGAQQQLSNITNKTPTSNTSNELSSSM